MITKSELQISNLCGITIVNEIVPSFFLLKSLCVLGGHELVVILHEILYFYNTISRGESEKVLLSLYTLRPFSLLPLDLIHIIIPFSQNRLNL